MMLRFVPAVLVWQSVQRDGSLSTGTFEEPLGGIVPPQVVVLLYTTICWFEVGVLTLEAREYGK